MTRLYVAALVVALCLTPSPTTADDGDGRDRVTLGGVRVELRGSTRQVVTVDHTRGYRATVTFWTLTRGEWVRRFRTRDGRIGYGGLVPADERRQGSGTTPLGTFRLLSAFGTHDRDRTWDLDYRRVRRGDYWVQDNASRFYNRYRNRAQGGFRWWLPPSDVNASERLTDYPRQYEYAVVTAFNREQVRYRGSGIFLHVNGRGATAGCVSAPRRFLQRLMKRLDPERAPVMAIAS